MTNVKCGINGFDSWNYGFVSCFFIFILMNSYINNTEVVRCEMNIYNLIQSGLLTAECITQFII